MNNTLLLLYYILFRCDSLLVTHQKTFVKAITRADIINNILSNGILPENPTLEQVIKLDESDSYNTISSSATLLECLRRMKKTVFYIYFYILLFIIIYSLIGIPYYVSRRRI